MAEEANTTSSTSSGSGTPKTTRKSTARRSKKTLGERFDMTSPTGRIQALYADRTENPVRTRGDENAQGTKQRNRLHDGPITGIKDALYALQNVVNDMAAVGNTRGDKWVADKFKEAHKLLDEAEKAAKKARG